MASAEVMPRCTGGFIVGALPAPLVGDSMMIWERRLTPGAGASRSPVAPSKKFTRAHHPASPTIAPEQRVAGNDQQAVRCLSATTRRELEAPLDALARKPVLTRYASGRIAGLYRRHCTPVATLATLGYEMPARSLTSICCTCPERKRTGQRARQELERMSSVRTAQVCVPLVADTP